LKLNPGNALEADIAREYINNIEPGTVAEYPELYKIKELLKSGAKYPMVKLKDYLILNENKIKPNKSPDASYKVLGVSNETGIFLNEKLDASETNQSYFVVAKNEFCYNPYRINVGSIGLNTFDYDNQIISGAYTVFACKEDELNPLYLDALFKSKSFLNYVNEKANGGVRMNFKFEDMEVWGIPLPSLDEQNAIVAQIEKQKQIIEGVEKIEKNWSVDDHLNLSSKEELVSNIAEVDGQIIKDEKLKEKLSEIYVGGENIESGTGRLLNLKSVGENGVIGPSYIFKPGQVVYSKVRPNLQKCFFAQFEGICSSDIYPLTVFNPRVVPEYFARVLQSEYFANKTQVFQDRAGMPKVNREQLATIRVSLPDKQEQLAIIEMINIQKQILEGLQKMKTAAQQKINQLLAEVWGMEYIEPIEEEIIEEIEE